MQRKIIKYLLLFVTIFSVMVLSSCSGCSGATYANTYELERSKEVTKAKNQAEWVVEKLNQVKEDAKTKAEQEGTTLTDEELVTTLKEAAKNLIINYPNYESISGKKDADKINKNYKVQFIKEDIKAYLVYIESATTASEENMSDFTEALKVETGCTSCFKAQTNTSAQEKINNVANQTDVYEISTIFTLKVKERMQEGEPLHFYADSFGDFMGHFFNNVFIFPVGWLLYALSSLFGGYYIVGLILTTLLIRTLGWPIYAKTNDMSIKMKAIEGDIAKIQAKYANRKDPDSQRMMQMEQARLYKQNGIGIGGCLLPFLQFPIFMAIFRAISRMPYTIAYGDMYTLNWGSSEKINSKFLGIDLFKDYTAGTTQLIWLLILVVLVSGTQFLSQWLSERRQKKAKEHAEEDIPAYRRQAVKQQANDTQRTMKMVMYMMIFTMAVFVWTSKAGLGIYWLIGNCYSMLQMYINSKQSEKKLAALKAKQRK